MKKLLLAALAACLTSGTVVADDKGPLVEIYMPSLCLACIDWGEHLINNGFRVKYIETTDMDAVRRRFKVPKEVESNVTARVGDYFVEGHVPAQDIRELLAEKPMARGLAVPGLPLGAPGLEGDSTNSVNCQTGCTILDPNATHEARRELYETLLVMPDGQTKTYARH
ncbi:MAG: DUF411 domain-containing protein [Rhodocyclaceae bacterium]|nr:DUF411 domain-containing protein [Rhodocyclaceae bacterium]